VGIYRYMGEPRKMLTYMLKDRYILWCTRLKKTRRNTI